MANKQIYEPSMTDVDLQQGEQETQQPPTENVLNKKVTSVGPTPDYTKTYAEATHHDPSTTIPEESEQQQPQPKYGNWDDVISYLEERKSAAEIPSAEQLKKEAKRQKIEGIISSIGDVASNLVGLFYSTKGAPATKVGGMTEAAQARFDKYKADLDKKKEEYYNYASTIARIKDAQDEKTYTRARNDMQDAIREAQAAHQTRLSELKELQLEGKISEQEQAAKANEEDRKLDQKIKEARIEMYNSTTNKNNRWRPSTGRSGGGATKKYPIYDKDGNVVDHAYTEVEASTATAKRGGTYPVKTTSKTSTRTNNLGQQVPSSSESRSSYTTGEGSGGNNSGVAQWKRPSSGSKKTDKAPLD